MQTTTQRHSASARPAAPFGSRTPRGAIRHQPHTPHSAIRQPHTPAQRHHRHCSGFELREVRRGRGAKASDTLGRSDRDFHPYSTRTVLSSHERPCRTENLQQTRTVQWYSDSDMSTMNTVVTPETVQRTCNTRAMLSCAAACGISAACGDGSERVTACSDGRESVCGCSLAPEAAVWRRVARAAA